VKKKRKRTKSISAGAAGTFCTGAGKEFKRKERSSFIS